MKIAKILVTMCAALAALTSIAADNDVVLRDLVECNPRQGLPNFFKKAESGKDIKVGYLGGSITAQNGWRVQSLKLFQKLYPNAKFAEINAAIGGTGSNFGVLRVQKEIIELKPDLVFVEFAVNDNGGGKAEIMKNMEGIVRQIWNDNPSADICFVYTIVERDIPVMKGGKMKRTSSLMEELADFYGIPSIDFGKAIVDLVNADKLVMKSDERGMSAVAGDVLNTKAAIAKDGKIHFAKDGVHPHTNTGHVIYTESIARSLPAIKAASKAAVPHKVGKKLTKEAPEKIDAIKLADVESLKNAPFLMGKAAWTQYLILKPEQELTVKFKGTALSVCLQLSTDSGIMEYSIDGAPFKKRRNFDPYCGWNRRSMSYICSNLPDTEHTVVFRASTEKFDKKAILFKQHHEDFEKNPKKFAPTNTFISALFINGKFISATTTAKKD